MPFNKIIGQESAKKILRNSLDKGRTVNAYIFSGPEGVGKSLTARVFSQALNCIEEDKPCGKCISCKKIQRDVHPDVRVVEGEGSSVKINQIRELQKDMGLRPYEGRSKVYIIKNAENMTPEAANCLLKTLEEPPEYGVIILITSNYLTLLPTIISRSQVISFYPLSQKDMERFLSDKLNDSPDRMRFFSAFSRGSPGEALKLVEEEEFIGLRDMCIELLDILMNKNNEKEVFLFVDGLIQRKNRIEEILNILIFLYRDLLLLKTHNKETIIVNVDIKEKLFDCAGKLSIEGFYSILEIIKETKKSLDSNVNFNIAVEVMLAKIMGVYRDELYGSRCSL